MKRITTMLTISLLAIMLLVSCKENNNTKTDNTTVNNDTKSLDKSKNTKNDNSQSKGTIENKENTGQTKNESKSIDDLVTIKEVVNKEYELDDQTLKYTYNLPIINIDKPGANKINEMFLNLEQAEEKRMGKYQSSLFINSKAFLNDGIISLVMEITKTCPGGIHIVNYDISNDKEMTTQEVIDKFNFNPQDLITTINKAVENDQSKAKGERLLISMDSFVNSILANKYDINNITDADDYAKRYKKYEEELKLIEKKTTEEKEQFVIENIDKLKAYVNKDGEFVFVHHNALPSDEEMVIE